MIKTFIIDDEIGAIKNLQVILSNYTDDIDIIGFATNTREAEFKIKHVKPDLIFLDIEMPEENGIEFLQRLGHYDFEVIFVTAYSEFAIKAFKLHAIDYILKPIDLREFKETILRIKEMFDVRQKYTSWLTQERLDKIDIHSTTDKQQKIVLRNKDRLDIVDFKHIISIEADGTYSTFSHFKKDKTEKIVMSYPLAYYSEILPESIFLRVHKSHIVNINYIGEIERDGQHFLTTTLGVKIPISKRRLSSVLTQIKT